MIKISTIQTHIFYQENDKTEYLVLQRRSNAKKYPKMWQVVTGKIEKNEKAFKAAYREAIEETSLEIVDFWHVPFIGFFYDIKNDLIQNVPVFAAKVSSKNVKLSLEHDNFKWLDFESTLEYLSLPSHLDGAKTLKKHIIDEPNKELFRIYI